MYRLSVRHHDSDLLRTIGRIKLSYTDTLTFEDTVELEKIDFLMAPKALAIKVRKQYRCIQNCIIARFI